MWYGWGLVDIKVFKPHPIPYQSDVFCFLRAVKIQVREHLTLMVPSLRLLSFQSIIYKLVTSPKLQSLLVNEQMREALARLHEPTYADPDPLFDESRNIDYSHAAGGISRQRFVDCFHQFVQVCVNQRDGPNVSGK